MRLCMKEPKNSIALLQIDNFHLFVLTRDENAGDRKIACTVKMKDRYDRNKKI